MPRQARTKSITGIYHVVVRGVNKQDIFHDDEDLQKYLKILETTKKISKFELYGYCLMSNHVHLLICEKNESISKVMERLGTRYAWWYNNKYDRVGHVFQDRFKSENVEDDKYLFAVSRYIHNNPVKAMMVEKAENYIWSSCKAYYGMLEYPCKLSDTEFILRAFSEEKLVAIERYTSYMIDETKESFMECKSITRKTDNELHKVIEKLLNGECITEIENTKKTEYKELIRKIKDIEGVTQRQIARVLGIPQSRVFKA